MSLRRSSSHNTTGSNFLGTDPYERVKLLLTHQTPIERIPSLIGMQPNVARAYVALVYQYHLDLKPEEMSPSQT